MIVELSAENWHRHVHCLVPLPPRPTLLVEARARLKHLPAAHPSPAQADGGIDPPRIVCCCRCSSRTSTAWYRQDCVCIYVWLTQTILRAAVSSFSIVTQTTFNGEIRTSRLCLFLVRENGSQEGEHVHFKGSVNGKIFICSICSSWQN